MIISCLTFYVFYLKQQPQQQKPNYSPRLSKVWESSALNMLLKNNREYDDKQLREGS